MADKTKKQKIQNDDVFALNDSAMIASLADTDSEDAPSSRGQQGFASMSRARQKEIASKGGKAAHAQGTAHEWTSEEAAAAGRRGGQNRSSKSQ